MREEKRRGGAKNRGEREEEIRTWEREK